MKSQARLRPTTLRPGFSVQLLCACGKSNKCYVISSMPMINGEYGRLLTVRAGSPKVFAPLHFADRNGTLCWLDECCEEAWLVRAESKSAKTAHWKDPEKFKQYYAAVQAWYKKQPPGIYKLKIPDNFIWPAINAGVFEKRRLQSVSSYDDKRGYSLLYNYCSRTR